IALLIAAAMVDLVDAVFERPPWLGTGATSLYLVGAGAAIGAYLTGRRAVARLTVCDVGSVAVARSAGLLAGFPRARAHRVLLLTAALIGVVFLQQTAERGARLVYE